MSGITSPSQLVNQLPVTVDFPKELDQLIRELNLVYRRIAYTVNTKEGGLFSSKEYISSQQYNLDSPETFNIVYRKCFDMVALHGGPITAGTTVSVAHNIVSFMELVHGFGGAKNSDSPAKFLPLPYVSATLVTDQVQIYATSTNVILVNGATQSTLTQATVVLEYLKD